jgi:hypothetical protein
MGSFYRSQHELVFVTKNGAAPHRNNVELGRHGRNRTNVWPYAVGPGFGRAGEEGRPRSIRRSNRSRWWQTRSSTHRAVATSSSTRFWVAARH